MAIKNINTDVNITGNLTVGGATTIINTTTVEVKDNILQLNTTQGSPDTATATTSGISIYRGDGITQASLIFDDADDTWDLTNNLVVAGNIIKSGGTSSQFLKANGSVDSNSYALSSHTHSAADITSGTLADARLTGVYSGITLQTNGGNTHFTTPNTGSASTNDRTVFGLAQYKSDVSATTGAIVFYAPNTSSTIMHRLRIEGFLYSGGPTVICVVQGYRTTGAWSQTSKINLGITDIQVRFAVDAAGKNCVILGDVGTTWSYPMMAITHAMFSHSGVTDAYCKDWTVGLVTSLVGFTQLTANLGNSAISTNILGNAGTATSAATLTTARTINGTSFNGSANITTANWGTARTLTIGNTGKSVNGSGNVSWSLSEIGALPLTGGTLSGALLLGGAILAGSSAKLQVQGFMRTGPIMIANGTTATTTYDDVNEKWITNNAGQLTIGPGNAHGDVILHAGNFTGYTDPKYLRSDTNDTAVGRITIQTTGNPTIGGTTPTDGYLVLSDGTNALGLDINEIHTTSTLYIGTNANDLVLRPAGVVDITANLDISPNNIAGNGRIRTMFEGGSPALEFSDNAGGTGADQFFAIGANDTNVGKFEIRFKSSAFGAAWASEGTLLAEFKADDNSVNFPQGKVGIGTTTTPRTALDLSGLGISFGYSSADAAERDWLISTNYSAYGDFHIRQSNAKDGNPYSAGTTRFMIGASGSVGIGTTSPLRKLHVVGNFAVNAASGEYYGVNITGGEGANPNILIGDWHNASANLTWDSTNGLLRIDSQYSTSGAPIVFSGNDAAIEYGRFTSAGNLGIGITNPSVKINTFVSGNLYDPQIKVSTDVTAVDTYMGIAPNKLIFYRNVSTGVNFEIQTSVTSGSSGGHIVFMPNNGEHTPTEKMRITTSGNIGIGTTSPGAKLELVDSSNSSSLLITSDGGNEQLRIRRYSNNNEQLILGFHSGDYAKIQAVEQGVGYRTLALNQDGGNVGIATTSPLEKLHVNGNIRLGTGGTNDLLGIYHGSTSDNYGAVRFYANGANTATIHNFPAAWQGGTIFTASTGSINMKGPNGVTFGDWDNIDVAFAYGSTSYFKNSVGIGTTTPKSKLHVAQGGNVNCGSLLIGPGGSGSTKWSFLAGSHYNQDTGSGNGSGAAGVALIGAYNDSTANNVYIGGGPYEINAATRILFNTHTSNTSTLGGTPRMAIISTGEVGIGTTVPGYKLSVQTAGDIYSADFYQSDSGTDKYNSIRVRGAMTSAVGYYGIGGSTTSNVSFRDAFVVGTQSAHDLNLATSDTARMTIASNGAMGFNYPTLAVRSFMFRALSGRPLVAEFADVDGINSVYIRPNLSGINLISSNYLSGGVYLPLSLSGRENAGDLVLATNGNIGIGTTNIGTEANIHLGAKGTIEGGQLVLQKGTSTSYDAHLDCYSDTLRILRGTNGTSSATVVASFNLSSSAFTSLGDVYAYSDARVKENVETIDNALNKVVAMRGVSYNRIDSDDKAKKIGVIAQEIQRVLPEVVSEQEDGMLSVSYGNIVGVLIEAIKEQQKQIDELKALLNVSPK